MFDWLFSRKKFNLPPGPWSLPFIGTPRVLRAKNLYEEFADLTKDYGPIVRVYIGPKMVIALNDEDSVKEALVDRKSDFSNRPQLVSGNLVSENGKNITAANYSQQWKAMKEVSKNALRNYLEDDRKLENVVHLSVTKVLNLMAKEKGPFNPMKYIDKIMFFITSYVCFGSCKDPDDPEFIQYMEHVVYALNTLGNLKEDYFPFLLNFYESQNYRDRKAAVAKLLSIMEEKYKEHDATFNPDQIRDLTDCMLKEWKQTGTQGNDGIKLPISYFKNILQSVFAGGFQDPCRAMYFALRYMTQFPDKQDRVQTELDEIIGKEKLPCIQDINNLPHSVATLYECMRLGTSPCLVPHQTRCDTKLGEYDIPENTTVFINAWYVHRNPDHWTNPLEFDPDRFLTNDNKICPTTSLSSFSKGDRSCVGELLARKSLPVIFSCILQRFKLTLPEGSDTEIKYAGSSFFLQPEDFEIVLEER